MIDGNIADIISQAEQHLKSRAKNIILSQNNDFLVMLVIGPNERTDFHRNNTEVKTALIENLIIICRNFCTKYREQLRCGY